MNFAAEVVDAAPPERLALVELARDGTRREWTFGEVAERSARLAGTLAARGIGRGDVVMTVIGNRPEWVFAMLACFRLGAVVLPCTEQLRAKDLALRIEQARPSLILADERNLEQLAGADVPVLAIPDERLYRGEPAPRGRSRRERAVPDHVHERHRRRAEGRAPRPALPLRPAAAGGAAGSPRARASWSGARPPAAGRSPPGTSSSRRGCAAPPRCCTTPASTRTSAWSCSRASASRCSAWRRPSTA